MEFALLGLLLFIALFNYLVYDKRLTSFVLVIVPYIAITLINNFIAVRLGFFRISDNTMFMVLVGSLMFFVGNCIVQASYTGAPLAVHEKERAADRDVMSLFRIKIYVSMVLGIRTLQLLRLIASQGLDNMIANDFELFVTRGLMGHLMISVFPLIPVLFYDWVKDRRNLYSLFLSGLYFVLAFVETEKAQVLTITIAIFLYCVFKNRSYLARGGVILASMIVVLFIGNYVAKFLLQNIYDAVGKEYYVYRLWNYIAGSLINSRCATDSIRAVKTNGFDYLLDVLLSLPNLFAGGMLHIQLGPDVRFAFPYIRDFMQVTQYTAGYRSQTGNVISTMTYIFGNGNWFAFIAVMILWGFICEMILCKMTVSARDSIIMFCCCFMAFSMVSFFGTYYTSASFSERLIYCLLWGALFNRHLHIRAGAVEF